MTNIGPLLYKSNSSINLEELQENVRNLARSYPNARYAASALDFQRRCYYDRGRVIDGPETPGCILGQAVRMTSEKDFIDLIGRSSQWDKMPWLPQSLFLVNMQKFQDAGLTWGECLEKVMYD